jgi:RES domain
LVAGARPIPLPPALRPTKLPTPADAAVPTLWRLHWEIDPRVPRHHSSGRFRFDAPQGEFAVTYLSADEYGCFGETYGDRQAIPPRDSERLLSRLTTTGPLRLIHLDDGELLKALHPHLDGRISSDIHYTITQAWSLALHEWYPEAHGIRYIARHATPHLNYCLFLERCSGLLELGTEGRLADLRELVIRACDAYGLAPRVFEPRDQGGW